MKKLGLIVVAALLAVGLVAVAEMDNKDFNFTVVAAATYTNSYTLRGEIRAIEVDITDGRTNALKITSGQATLWTNAVTADARWDVLYPAYGSTASALTSSGSGAIAASIKTNSVVSYDGTLPVTNTVLTYFSTASASATPFYTPGVVAGPVTMVVSGNAGETRTNSLKVTIIYEK